MNGFFQRHKETIWSGVGIAAALYLLGARRETLVKYTIGALAGAWVANLSAHKKQPQRIVETDQTESAQAANA